MEASWPLLIAMALALAVVRVARRAVAARSQSRPAAVPTPQGEPRTEPLGGAPASGTDLERREGEISTRIGQLAKSVFPDDTGLAWDIRGFEHRERLTLVEVEPRGGWVGYPRLKLAVSLESKEPTVIATYCPQNGGFVLLCSVRNPGEPLPHALV